jgi:hypothetical protein
VRNPWPQFKRAGRHLDDAPDVVGDVVAEGCLSDFRVALAGIAAVVVIGGLVLLLLFLWELFLFAVVAALWELLVVVLLVAAGLIARFALRHPWTVQATHPDGRVFEWRVRGFGRSKSFVRMAQARVDAGWQPDQIDESHLAED